MSTRSSNGTISTLAQTYIRLIQRHTKASLPKLRTLNSRLLPDRRSSHNHRTTKTNNRLRRNTSSIMIRQPQMRLPRAIRRPHRARIYHRPTLRLNRTDNITTRRIRRILNNTSQTLSASRQMSLSRLIRSLRNSRRLINNKNRPLTRHHRLHHRVIQTPNRNNIQMLHNGINRTHRDHSRPVPR